MVAGKDVMILPVMFNETKQKEGPVSGSGILHQQERQHGDAWLTWSSHIPKPCGETHLGLLQQKFFTGEVVKHWQGLLREVEAAPSLETLKARLDGTH